MTEQEIVDKAKELLIGFNEKIFLKKVEELTTDNQQEFREWIVPYITSEEYKRLAHKYTDEFRKVINIFTAPEDKK